VVGDTFFLTSFFVLGGKFWDKVKALFVYEARAVLRAMVGSPVTNVTTGGT